MNVLGEIIILSRNERYRKLDCIYEFCPYLHNFPNGIVAFKITHYVAIYENFKHKSKNTKKTQIYN